MSDQVKATAIKVLAQLKGCPVCGDLAKETCPGEDGSYRFRNISDEMSKTFACGSEFSVDGEGEIISRGYCPNPSWDAASSLCSARDDMIDEAEDAA